MEKTWVQKAIDWKATPKDLREPKTARELYDKLQVKESTFYYEISKPEIQKRILDKCLYLAKNKAPDVLKKLEDNAIKGNNRAIELYLKFILEIAEKINSDITSGGKPITEINVNIKDYGTEPKQNIQTTTNKQG